MTLKTTRKYAVWMRPGLFVTEVDEGTGLGDDKTFEHQDTFPPVTIEADSVSTLMLSVEKHLTDTYGVKPSRPQPKSPTELPLRLGFAALGMIAGTLVGGALSSAAAASAPVQVQTPVHCTSALNRADELITAYGEGFRAVKMTMLEDRTAGLRDAADEVNRITPYYISDSAKCKESSE